MTLQLTRTNKGDYEVKHFMYLHYSAPFGFVGRQLIYKIMFGNELYGIIAGGSATKFLPGRNEFFGQTNLNYIVNNTFFHVRKLHNKYPLRNFTTRVIELWRYRMIRDWNIQYNDNVLGFETLVELPRTGELYRRDGWVEVGETKGFTCKRESSLIRGPSTDSWSGTRVWDYKNLRPKKVLVRMAD